jgi:hypothetical protein
MMTPDQAIECVQSFWQVTCQVGQKQAADALTNEVVRLRLQVEELQKLAASKTYLPFQACSDT